MSTDTIHLDLKDRAVVRKGLAKLRAEGQIPAVIHDHGKESMHVMADHKVLGKVYAEAGKHHPVELTIGSKKRLALIKDVDFEPVRHEIRHVVFQSVKTDEMVSAEIPIRMLGEDIPANKKSLLVLQQLDHVEVEALPRDLPDEITIDAMSLEEVGDNLIVAQLEAPTGVTITTDPTAQIAIVEMPKDQIAEADAAAASLAEDAAASGDAEEEEEKAAPEEGEGEGAEGGEEAAPADQGGSGKDTKDAAKDKE